MELTIQGCLVRVDDDCAAWVARYDWYLQSNGLGDSYAAAWSEGRTVLLHRLVMGEPPGLHVDHRDRNTLDNRRANLRACIARTTPPAQVSQQQIGLQGVSRENSKRPRWRATIVFEKKQPRLGSLIRRMRHNEAYRAAGQTTENLRDSREQQNSRARGDGFRLPLARRESAKLRRVAKCFSGRGNVYRQSQ
jgi:hypothetical protein